MRVTPAGARQRQVDSYATDALVFRAAEPRRRLRSNTRSDSPRGWPSPLRRRRSPDRRASDDGSEGMGGQPPSQMTDIRRADSLDGNGVDGLRPDQTSRELLRLPTFTRLSPLPCLTPARDHCAHEANVSKEQDVSWQAIHSTRPKSSPLSPTRHREPALCSRRSVPNAASRACAQSCR